MAGSATATLKRAGIRGAAVGGVAGLLAWAIPFFSPVIFDEPCPPEKTRVVKRLEESGKNERLLAEAKKDAKDARKKCEKRKDREQRDAVIAGFVVLLSAFGVRGGIEGVRDRRRQIAGTPDEADVQR